MIKAELKGKPYLQDMRNIAEFSPRETKHFSVTIEFGIGEPNVEGFDNYTLTVCTPSWLESELKANGKPFLLEGMLLVENYNPEEITSRIREIVETTSGKDWDECNSKLLKYFNWEFEN